MRAAILNSDVVSLFGCSNDNHFLVHIQKSTFEVPSNCEIKGDEFALFRLQLVKLLEMVRAGKKSPKQCNGFLFHSIVWCFRKCGTRLPTPFCPAGGCNKNIEQVFDKLINSDNGNKKCKAEEDLLLDASIPNHPVVSVAVSAPDIIVIDDDGDEGDNDDDKEVMFLECRKP